MQPVVNTVEGAVDIRAAFRSLKQGWKYIALSLAIALAGAVIYLNIATYRYAVEMRVAPASSPNGDGLSSKLSQFSGLAAVAGVALPDASGSGSFRLYVEAVHSRDVAEKLARNPAIMHGAFRHEWDARTKQWRRPDGFVSDTAAAVKSALGVPRRPWTPPGAARLQTWMEENISVDQNPKSPVVGISVQVEDPAFGLILLDHLNDTIDGLLRQRVLARTDDYIRYLSGRLPAIQLSEQRLSIFQALGEQERLKMAASSDRPFAADMFEHPAASERPVTPKPFKVLGVALILGLAAGVAMALMFRRAPVAVP